MTTPNKPKHPILKVTDLSARYGKVTAVANANIMVNRGSIVTVIGANGAGKSTLLNAVMGSLPLSGNSTGGVEYLGVDVGGWQVERRVSAGMSLVPERRELFGSMTVEDNLLLGGFRLYRAGSPVGARPSTKSMSFSRGLRSGAANTLEPYPGANARCWQSVGR